jgi:hypothetical protein
MLYREIINVYSEALDPYETHKCTCGQNVEPDGT